MNPQSGNVKPTKTPEQWLEAAAPEKTEGIFKVFLGYAPGVGKTFNMLSEAIRRSQRGEDVVIGFVETHQRARVIELASQLEAVPTRKVEYKGTFFEELDVDAVLARKPAVVVIDELAHTNIPGSKHEKRYEDVLELLHHRIDVLSALNVQHIESVAPSCAEHYWSDGARNGSRIGCWGARTKWFWWMLRRRRLQTRMRRGDIYPLDRRTRGLWPTSSAGEIFWHCGSWR